MHAFIRARVLTRPYKILKGYDHQVRCICIANLNHVDSTRTIFNNRTIKTPLLSSFFAINNSAMIRNISIGNVHFAPEPLKPSSKVEATVQELKKKQEPQAVAKAVVKKSLTQKIKDEIVHYYHGFRLLGIDMKVSSVLVWRVLNGKTLSRREYRLLIRTVGDMFRLVPFSVFIIVPFMELLLPVFITLFPGMLPSTFQTATEKEDKIKQSLKVKIDMAKFLQETLDDMAVQHKEHNSDSAKEFTEFFQKIRSSHGQVSNEEIMKFSKLFEDEITLDSLSRSQLIALCRVLEVQALGTNYLLRFQLRMKLRSLAADDKMIQKEGVESMTLAEVQQACRARGMRAYGLSEERLRKQLNQWLELSLNEKVPPSLLLLSRAMMLPETIPTSDKLKATISALPETIVTQTKAAIGEKEGKIDNKVKLEVLKEEVRRVTEERQERREEKKKLEKEQEKEKEKELLVDKAPILSAAATPILEDTATKISLETLEKVEKKDKKLKEEHMQSKDFQIIEDAIDKVSKGQQFIVEKGEIEELKEQLADYEEDVQDLKQHVASQPTSEIKESKAAQRLFKSVNRMIGKLDTVLVSLEEKEAKLKKDLAIEETDVKKEELLKIDDIMAAIKHFKDIPDQKKEDQIVSVLRKMDDDKDGSLKVEDVLKVIEIIGKENVNLSDKQIDELIELLDKEELLEVEDKIEKALQKQVKDGDKKTSPVPQAAGGAESSPSKGKCQDSTPTPPKPKFETKPPIVPPPNSIEKNNPKDNSKML